MVRDAAQPLADEEASKSKLNGFQQFQELPGRKAKLLKGGFCCA